MPPSIPRFAAVARCCAAGVQPLAASAARGLPLAASVAGAPTVADRAPEVPNPVPVRPRALLGPVTREQVEAAAPGWVQAGVEAKPHLPAAPALAAVEPGAEVTVPLGTWGGDSRRGGARLRRGLDGIRGPAPGGA